MEALRSEEEGETQDLRILLRASQAETEYRLFGLGTGRGLGEGLLPYLCHAEILLVS